MRKLTLSILTLIMVICCVGLWACITPETPPVEHTHNFSTEWIVDNTNHWHKCDCGEKGDEAMHTPGAEATQTTPQTCTVCGYVVKEALGEEPTPEIPEHTHEYTYLTKNDYHHWYECECGENNGKSEHSGGTATCLKKAVCKICDQEYGDLLEHSHDYVVYDSVNHWYECECGDKKDIKEHIPGAPATETTHQTCTECGYVITPAIGHVHSYSKIKYDKVNHWNECECGNKEDAVKHTITSQPKDGAGDKHVCEEREYLNKCDGCDYSYDSTITLGHKYVKIAEGNYEDGCQSFNVLLECEECSSFIKVVATKMGLRGEGDEHGSVERNCKTAGYDEYSYTYMNTDGTAPVETIGYIIKEKSGLPSAEHTFISGDFKFMSALNAQHYYGKANGAALTALLENEVIRPIASAPVLCSKFVTIVGECSVCKHPITFDITGPHREVGVMKQSSTCTRYGYEYKECTVANCLTGGEVVYNYIDAAKHHFIPVSDSENAFMANPTVGGRVTFRCYCNTTVDLICTNILAKVPGDGLCFADKTPYVFEYSYTVTNYDEVEKKEVKETVNATETLYKAAGPDSHKLIVGSKIIDGIDNNAHIANNDTNIRVWWSAFEGDAPLLRWITGKPAGCLTERIAVFDCADCGNPIIVNICGDCVVNIVPAQAKVTEPTCTEEGYTERPCKVCGTLIKDLATVPATGHAYEWTFSVNPEVVGKGYYATVNAGVLNGACKNTANKVACGATGIIDAPATVDQNGVVTSKGYVIETVKANCCDEGYAIIKYYFNIDSDEEFEIIKSDFFIIEADGNHNH